MRLVWDGVTPNVRLVLVDCLENGGYAFELDQPCFVAVGDRVVFEGGDPVIVQTDGVRFVPCGSWSTRCRGRTSPRI